MSILLVIIWAQISNNLVFGSSSENRYSWDLRLRLPKLNWISVWIRQRFSLVMAIWVLNCRLELYLFSDEDPKTNLYLIWDQIMTKRMVIWGYYSDWIYLCSQIKIQKSSYKRLKERILIFIWWNWNELRVIQTYLQKFG